MIWKRHSIGDRYGLSQTVIHYMNQSTKKKAASSFLHFVFSSIFLRGLTEWLSLFPVPLHLFLFVFHIEMEYIVSGRLGKDWQGRVKPSCCTLDWLELLLRVCGPVWPSLGTIWPLPFRCIQLGQPHCDLQGGSGRWPSISLRALTIIALLHINSRQEFHFFLFFLSYSFQN